MGDKAMPKQKKFGVREFFKAFPSEDACLDHILAVRHGKTHTCRKCGVIDATFHRITGRRGYACAHCGDHLYPCVGTIFEDSRTPLQIWFYAIFLFVSTRHGVSGRELSRQLGVTVKTGWRMGKQIRELIGKTQDFSLLQGHIEIDEAYVGAYAKGQQGRPGKGSKTPIVGMKERGGRFVAAVVPNVRTATMRPLVLDHIKRGSTISTDEYAIYNLLESDGYQHGRVKHSAEEYARWDGDVHHHVNGVESFWRLFKSAIASTHIHVSEKYMQTYLNEFAFRQTHRKLGQAMFDLLIASV
jgi:transposase-like protein